jgi:hypothetical protein
VKKTNSFSNFPLARWNNAKPMKSNSSQSSSISDNLPKIHRKSSMQYYNIQPYTSGGGNGGNKSSSNFGSNNTSTTSSLTNFQRSASREKLNQFSLMQQHHHHQFNQQLTAPAGQHNTAPPYHRHSLNNLMPFNSAQQQFMNRRNSSCGSDRSMMGAHTLASPLGSHEKNLSDSGLSTSTSLNSSTAPTASDINSRLESLCRQMTEQAIN